MRESTWSLAELVVAVTKELGSEWKPVPEEDRDIRKIQRGEVILYFRQATYGSAAEVGRVTVSGAYWHLAAGVQGGYNSPRSLGVIPYDGKEPEIGVAVSRGAAVVAKEITRRLLPEVERITAAMKEKVVDQLAYQAETLRNAERFAEAVGGEVRTDGGYSTGREVSVYANGTGAYISARVSGDSVRMEHFTVDIDTALAVGRAIRGQARAAA
jgi:hypothetical protein